MLAILFAFLVAFGEALLIVGLFVPLTTVLVWLSALIGLGEMTFLPVFAATVAGAIAGDALSFLAGVHWKQQIRKFRPFSRYSALMDKGEQFILVPAADRGGCAWHFGWSAKAAEVALLGGCFEITIKCHKWRP